MIYIVLYLLTLLIIFTVLYVFQFAIKGRANRLGDSAAFKYIEKKYDLNMDKNRAKTLARILVFNNSLILSIPIYVVLFIYDMSSIGRMFLLFGITFIVFIVAILVSYKLIGIMLKKKGW